MLIGEYTHTIDEKNRVSLPAKFRKEIGKKVILTPGLDTCIFLFTTKEWANISGKLSQSSMLNPDTRSFNRFLLGGAVEAEIDGSGRILVPDFLKERAKLSEKVSVIGVSSRVEIWDEANWKEFKQKIEKEADSLAQKLNQVGIL